MSQVSFPEIHTIPKIVKELGFRSWNDKPKPAPLAKFCDDIKAFYNKHKDDVWANSRADPYTRVLSSFAHEWAERLYAAEQHGQSHLRVDALRWDGERERIQDLVAKLVDRLLNEHKKQDPERPRRESKLQTKCFVARGKPKIHGDCPKKLLEEAWIGFYDTEEGNSELRGPWADTFPKRRSSYAQLKSREIANMKYATVPPYDRVKIGFCAGCYERNDRDLECLKLMALPYRNELTVWAYKFKSQSNDEVFAILRREQNDITIGRSQTLCEKYTFLQKDEETFSTKRFVVVPVHLSKKRNAQRSESVFSLSEDSQNSKPQSSLAPICETSEAADSEGTPRQRSQENFICLLDDDSSTTDSDSSEDELPSIRTIVAEAHSSPRRSTTIANDPGATEQRHASTSGEDSDVPMPGHALPSVEQPAAARPTPPAARASKSHQPNMTPQSFRSAARNLSARREARQLATPQGSVPDSPSRAAQKRKEGPQLLQKSDRERMPPPSKKQRQSPCLNEGSPTPPNRLSHAGANDPRAQYEPTAGGLPRASTDEQLESHIQAVLEDSEDLYTYPTPPPPETSTADERTRSASQLHDDPGEPMQTEEAWDQHGPVYHPPSDASGLQHNRSSAEVSIRPAPVSFGARYGQTPLPASDSSSSPPPPPPQQSASPVPQNVTYGEQRSRAAPPATVPPPLPERLSARPTPDFEAHRALFKLEVRQQQQQGGGQDHDHDHDHRHRRRRRSRIYGSYLLEDCATVDELFALTRRCVAEQLRPGQSVHSLVFRFDAVAGDQEAAVRRGERAGFRLVQLETRDLLQCMRGDEEEVRIPVEVYLQ